MCTCIWLWNFANNSLGWLELRLHWSICLSIYLRILFIYVRESEPEKAGAGGRGRERGSSRLPAELSRKPDARLDSKTLGTWPEPKTELHQLSHPGTAKLRLLFNERIAHFIKTLNDIYLNSLKFFLPEECEINSSYCHLIVHLKESSFG